MILPRRPPRERIEFGRRMDEVTPVDVVLFLRCIVGILVIVVTDVLDQAIALTLRLNEAFQLGSSQASTSYNISNNN